jgi:hypothetical protein
LTLAASVVSAVQFLTLLPELRTNVFNAVP